MALTGKKRVFADAVLAGLSNREAAIAAKYSAKTASAAGSRLVKDPDVVVYLAEQRKAEKKKARPPAKKGAAPPSERPAFDLAALVTYTDPKAFLRAAMNEPKLDMKQRIDAAKALMPFEHQRVGEGGKKEQRQAEAQKVASRFASAPPPRLAAAGGKKV
jgi:phage terminase small subunit